MPCIPEDISENIVKQIIRNKLNDSTSSWNCKRGFVFARGVQECKCLRATDLFRSLVV
jgi:hypothetical protein